MKSNFDEDEIWELIGHIKISQSRYKTLKSLEKEFLMPSEITQKTKLRDYQISTALNDLKDNKLVICRNENAKKGRIYQITDLGTMILEIIENNKG